ncbi:hypothetical protein GGR56DRAFT_4345 [Xylariaceae sp. FL0804]|nr:hypothetical protein GGR56DRAFT_4345 [Xylariaceae sp. FL0804]
MPRLASSEQRKMANVHPWFTYRWVGIHGLRAQVETHPSGTAVGSASSTKAPPCAPPPPPSTINDYYINPNSFSYYCSTTGWRLQCRACLVPPCTAPCNDMGWMRMPASIASFHFSARSLSLSPPALLRQSGRAPLNPGRPQTWAPQRGRPLGKHQMTLSLGIRSNTGRAARRASWSTELSIPRVGILSVCTDYGSDESAGRLGMYRSADLAPLRYCAGIRRMLVGRTAIEETNGSVRPSVTTRLPPPPRWRIEAFRRLGSTVHCGMTTWSSLSPLGRPWDDQD